MPFTRTTTRNPIEAVKAHFLVTSRVGASLILHNLHIPEK